MNKDMEFVLEETKKYRLCFKYPHYKVKVKYLWFWVTIKSFTIGKYSTDGSFCYRECEELYNKIINPYGKL